MPDKILVKDLLLRGIIGLNDWERENRQDILINLILAPPLILVAVTHVLMTTSILGILGTFAWWAFADQT